MKNATVWHVQASSTSQTVPAARHGPGPYLMGADTSSANDVYNRDSQDLGEIKEIMLDIARGA